MNTPGRVAMEALMAAQNSTNDTELAWEAAAQAVIDYVAGPDWVMVSRLDLQSAIGFDSADKMLAARARLGRALS